MWPFTRKELDPNILKEIAKKSRIKRYLEFVFGALLVAVSFNLFLAPNNIVSGGVSGVSLIIKYIFGLDPSIFIAIVDVILLLISWIFLGKEKTIGSVCGSLLFPLFIKLTEDISVYIDIDSSQLLLSAIFGGVLSGLGSGLIFKAGFSLGGTDIINQIISKYAHLSLGNSMLVSDGLIVVASSFIFGLQRMIYAIIVLYIISMMTDRVVLGISDSKAIYIITDKEEEIKEFVMKNLSHGITIFKAHGGYSKERQNVLLCVIPTKDYFKLTEGIHLIDESAFFVVTDAYEVFGGA